MGRSASAFVRKRYVNLAAVLEDDVPGVVRLAALLVGRDDSGGRTDRLGAVIDGDVAAARQGASPEGGLGIFWGVRT